jgi:hypothetical protein
VLAHKSPGSWTNYPESTRERETIIKQINEEPCKKRRNSIKKLPRFEKSAINLSSYSFHRGEFNKPKTSSSSYNFTEKSSSSYTISLSYHTGELIATHKTILPFHHIKCPNQEEMIIGAVKSLTVLTILMIGVKTK